jgi:Flp pilus assembly protein TadG
LASKILVIDSLASDQGAVTAEFMLLLPALIMLFATVLGSVTFATDRIALEAKGFEAARSLAIGLELVAEQGIEIEKSVEGALTCAKISKQSLIPMSTKLCVMQVGQ